MHAVSAAKPLQCILIATTAMALHKLSNHEGELFREMLKQLVNPSDYYVEDPSFGFKISGK